MVFNSLFNSLMYKNSGKKYQLTRYRVLAIAFVTLLATSNASASYIFDTGAGDPTAGGFALSPEQSLAGQFTLTDSYIIDSVEGWFNRYIPGSGNQAPRTATAAIYTDDGAFPGTPIYHQQFTIDNPTNEANAWDGAYNINWALDPGTYWLVFEVREGDNITTNVSMPYVGFSNPDAFDKYAYNNIANADWTVPGIVVEGWGMRINAVPIPAAIWLFGSGLIGLIGIARRKKL